MEEIEKRMVSAIMEILGQALLLTDCKEFNDSVLNLQLTVLVASLTTFVMTVEAFNCGLSAHGLVDLIHKTTAKMLNDATENKRETNH